MVLPKKFKFESGGTIYNAEVVSEGEVKVSWVSSVTHTSCSTSYPSCQVELVISDGTWKIIPEYNGVDAEGSLKYFGKEMLQPFMRVKTRNGQMWVVVPNVQLSADKESNDSNDEYVLSSNTGWGEFYTDASEKYSGCIRDIGEEYAAVEVYEAPKLNRDMLAVERVGNPIWKATQQEIPNNEKTKEPTGNFEQRLKHIEDTLDGLKRAHRI